MGEGHALHGKERGGGGGEVIIAECSPRINSWILFFYPPPHIAKHSFCQKIGMFLFGRDNQHPLGDGFIWEGVYVGRGGNRVFLFCLRRRFYFGRGLFGEGILSRRVSEYPGGVGWGSDRRGRGSSPVPFAPPPPPPSWCPPRRCLSRPSWSFLWERPTRPPSPKVCPFPLAVLGGELIEIPTSAPPPRACMGRFPNLSWKTDRDPGVLYSAP